VIKRSYWVYIANIVVTGLGMLVIMAGLVIVNAITINDTSTTNTLIALNYVMLALGVVAFLMCVAYIVVLPFYAQSGSTVPVTIDRRESYEETRF
jgi:hypothetical protein